MDYVQEKLPHSTHHRVEDHLLDCPLCAAAVEGFTQHGVPDAKRLDQLAGQTVQRAQAALALATDNSARLSLVDSETPSSTHKKPAGFVRSLNYWVRRGAVAAILLLLLIGFSNYWQQTTNDRLYSAFFAPQPRFGYSFERTLRPKQDRSNSVLDQAIHFYQHEQYAESLIAWRAYFDETPQPDDIRTLFYAGLAALSMGRKSEAKRYFAQLPKDIPGAKGEEINWYRSLLYLKLNDRRSAVSTLRSIQATPESTYGRELAPLLLKKLNKPIE